MSGAYQGGCHCGAIRWVFTTRLAPSAWDVRACQCAFCRMRATRCTSDAQGSVEISVADANALERYRFGLATADFLICRRCGVYIGALVESHGRAYATINLNTMTTPVDDVAEARAIDYGAENASERIDRRTSRWTPVVFTMNDDLRGATRGVETT